MRNTRLEMNRKVIKKARGSYSLGGCETCRRRHVKCDKVRPHCLTCQAVGVECDGFQYSGIRWISDEDEQKEGNENGGDIVRRSRRTLYPGQYFPLNHFLALTGLW